MTMCLRLRPSASFPTGISHTFSAPKHPSLSFKPLSRSSRFSTTTTTTKIAMSSSSSQSIVEHIVLFKVKDDTDQSKLTAMIGGLNALSSLDSVLHLSAGPLLCNRSSSFNFTHILHSRYKSKDDLHSYAQHPSHTTVVKESVLPICDDLMAVDWIAEDLQGPVALPLGSALRVSFLKLKESLGEGAKSKVLETIRGVRNSFGQIDQLSVGENFSPARAKGFSIAALAVFPGVNELEAMDSNQELVSSHKEEVRGYSESVIVVDYVVSLTQPASL